MHDAIDELMRVQDEARRVGPPDGASEVWATNSNAVLAAGAMALRTAQAIEMLVRSGFAIESAGLVRKLGEIAQHAAGVAHDSAGDYARNWGRGAGQAGKASTAYVRGVEDPEAIRAKWKMLSELDHANLKPFLNFACWQSGTGSIVFPVMGKRHAALDVEAPASAAWDVMRVAAAISMVYPDIDPADLLKRAARMRAGHEEAQARSHEWAVERLRSWGEEVGEE
jgi:hypothetical protein